MPEPAGMERRRFERTPVKLPLLYKRTIPAPLKAGAGCAHNLAEEGACLELSERLEPPSILQVIFQTDRGPLQVTAAIMWAAVIKEKGEGVLHGVVFPELSAEQRQVLGEILSAVREQGKS